MSFAQHSHDNLIHSFAEVLDAAGFASRLQECWGNRPFRLKAVFERSVSESFGGADLVRVLDQRPELFTRTELIRDGRRTALTNDATSAVPRRDVIQRALAAGLTVLVRRFDYDHEPTAAVAHVLSDFIRRPVFATLFFTYYLEPAFPAHYDAADVFAMQLLGTKCWKLFESVAPPPASDIDVKPIEIANAIPESCEELYPGDLLYVPRGTIHAVCAMSGPCAHISFGVRAHEIRPT